MGEGNNYKSQVEHHKINVRTQTIKHGHFSHFLNKVGHHNNYLEFKIFHIVFCKSIIHNGQSLFDPKQKQRGHPWSHVLWEKLLYQAHELFPMILTPAFASGLIGDISSVICEYLKDSVLKSRKLSRQSFSHICAVMPWNLGEWGDLEYLSPSGA